MMAAEPTAATPVVLLVEDDAGDRERYGGGLESAGMSVLNCPGPHLPGYGCVGSCGGACALADAADIAILDARRMPGLARRGMPAWRLIRFYLGLGKPVVVIADNYRKDRSFRPEQLCVLRPDPGPVSLLLAVRRLLKAAQGW